MPRVELTQAAYTARSVIASAQKCVNLMPEVNPPGSPCALTHYQTPGLTQLAVSPNIAKWRCLYTATNGELFGVVGSKVYYISATFVFTELFSITDGTDPCVMADNGQTILLVDGTANGYSITLADHTHAQLSDPAFYGANWVQIIDEFFVLNRPDTNQWYISLPLSTTFDPLDIAAKVGYPDPIQAVQVVHREILLIGTRTTEVWFNAGAQDFPFQILSGAFIEHGTCAKYSIAKQDLAVYALSQDQQGRAMVIKIAGYQAKRISTHAIENEFRTYARVDDAIGFTYQEEGHVFYFLTFPTASKTWVFDESTELWHERAWIDENGKLLRHRANCCAYAYNQIIVGDYENGILYSLDLDAYTDNGNPIPRIRSFPHIVSNGKRVIYNQFLADIEVGTDDGTLDRNFTDGTLITGVLATESDDPITTEGGDPISVSYLPSELISNPVVSLRFSRDRGVSYGNRMEQSLGRAGEYLTTPQWQRIGLARDGVFELSWSVPTKAALNGAWVKFTECAS